MTGSLRLFPLVLLMACTQGLQDDRFATGSQIVATSKDYSAIYAANPSVGTVSRMDVNSGELTELDVGGEPTRIARFGDKMAVTLRSERSLAVLRDNGGTLELEATVTLGAEPYGVVASEAGDRLYVALSQQDEVVELDASTLAVLRTFPVPNEPKFLALTPGGESLFVSSAMRGRLSWIDLDAGSVEALELPEVDSNAPNSLDVVELTPRLTGDPAVSPDGKILVVPTVWVDNTSPLDDTLESDEPVSNSYGSTSGAEHLGRFNGSVMMIPLSHGEPDMSGAEVQFLIGDANLGNARVTVRSYPTSATWSPDGDSVFVTIESSRAVAVISRADPREIFKDEVTGIEMVDSGGSVVGPESFIDSRFAQRAMAHGGTRGMPQGLVFLDDTTAWVHSDLTHSLEPLATGRLLSAVNDELKGETRFTSPQFSYPEITPSTALSLPEDIEEGRQMFFSSVDSRMAASGAGVSCSACHFDGRNDGLTWPIADAPRQTLSLAGEITPTAPVTWFSEVPSVMDEAMITSQERMGGADLSERQGAQIAAFIDFTREVDTKDKGSRSEAVLRGEEIFNRADTACGSCHPAPLYTDNQSHALYGVAAVNTPSLIGVAATAPYLHTGAADSLGKVLETSKAGLMGDTSSLSAQETADLEAFLRSL